MPDLSLDKLLERIAKGKVVPAVLLLGTESYLRDTCRAKLIEAYVAPEARDWGVSRFSAANDSIERALGQAQSLPMLVPQQVVFVEEVDALESLGDKARDDAVKSIAKYLENPAPFTVLVFEAAELDQRMKLAKTLMDHALTVTLALDENPEARVAVAVKLTQNLARERNVEIDQDAAEELADLLDGALSGVEVEIEKLATFVGARGRITRADVEQLVVCAKKYSVWQFAEMIAGRQSEKALVFLHSLLREGEPPAQIVGALAWMVRALIAVQEMPKNVDVWQVTRQLRMRRDTAEMALREARKIPKQQLLDGLAALYEADSLLKSGFRDQGAVMEFLVARLTGKSEAKLASAAG
jgi:DNA polymerase-3 subunit delta